MKCFFRLAPLLLLVGCATFQGDGSWAGPGKQARKTRRMLFEIECAPFARLTNSLRNDIREKARDLLAEDYRNRVEDRRGYVHAAHGFAAEAARQSDRVIATHFGLACLRALEGASAPDGAASRSMEMVLREEPHPWLTTPVGLVEPGTVQEALEDIKTFAEKAYAAFPDLHPKVHVLTVTKRLNLEEDPEPEWIDIPAVYPEKALRVGWAWQNAYAADQFGQLIPAPGAEDAAKIMWAACCADELEPALGGAGGQGGP